MAFFKNVSSLGALELPLVGRVIEAGEVFEVTDAQAERLVDQPDVWQATTKKGEGDD